MPKKIPMRKCTGCGEMKEKKSLIRIVRTPEGEIKLDRTGKMNGRGAYLCRSEECAKLAVKKNAFGRNLKTEISRQQAESLAEQIAQLCR